MNSSGILAFYLSESEDPDLWRAMAQLSQDDRTEVFRNALRYFVTSYDGPIFAGDSEEERDDPVAPSLFSSPQTSHGYHGPYESYESDEQLFEGTNTVSRDMYTGSEEDTEWFEDGYTQEQDPQEGHTMYPAFSRAEKAFHEEHSRKRFSEAPAHRTEWGADYESRNGKRDKAVTGQSKQMTAKVAVGGRMEKDMIRSEIQEVSLDEVFSDAPASNPRMLRGLDFLLKNVIGEETDEAVLEAIRRKKTVVSQ